LRMVYNLFIYEIQPTPLYSLDRSKRFRKKSLCIQFSAGPALNLQFY
jgi:hypothetical protein